ncbi:MAG: type II CAAX endopeptidase family protein [Actinomycetota bacterium]|jgi:membrane protease YdiL (CAAX protease family)|nr:type II CAAX endopeptidase family protein [Actinomycetota bacterium]
MAIDRDSSKFLDIKWNVRDALISVLALIALLVGIYFSTAKILEFISGNEYLSITSINNLSFSVLYGIQVLLMVGLVWFFAIYWRKSTPRDLGLRYYSIFKTLWYTFLALLAIFILSFSYVYIVSSAFNIEAPTSKIEQLVRGRNISTNILLVVVAVVAPFSEEIFFRGFLYSAFKKAWGINAGLFLSSLLFALAHMEIYSFIPIFLIGWILAYMFEKTRSLFPVIFLHAIYNLILILLLLGQVDMINLY